MADSRINELIVVFPTLSEQQSTALLSVVDLFNRSGGDLALSRVKTLVQDFPKPFSSCLSYSEFVRLDTCGRNVVIASEDMRIDSFVDHDLARIAKRAKFGPDQKVLFLSRHVLLEKVSPQELLSGSVNGKILNKDQCATLLVDLYYKWKTGGCIPFLSQDARSWFITKEADEYILIEAEYDSRPGYRTWRFKAYYSNDAWEIGDTVFLVHSH